MSFPFVRASAAHIVTVRPGSDDIPVFGVLLALPSESQLPSIGTSILILFGIVYHILDQIGIDLPPHSHMRFIQFRIV